MDRRSCPRRRWSGGFAVRSPAVYSARMKLILGNKNYSSWSMRAGVVAAAFDLPVVVETVWLDEPDAQATKRQISPAGRVPILLVDELTVCAGGNCAGPSALAGPEIRPRCRQAPPHC